MAQPLRVEGPGDFAPEPLSTAGAAGASRAFQILRLGFTVLPILAGLDKFFHWLVNWDMYLAPWVTDALNINARTFMMGVGAIEIVAGLIVSFAPRFGAYLVAFWLWGITANLLTHPNRYYDVALRDFGLSLGALALAQLAAPAAHRTRSDGAAYG